MKEIELLKTLISTPSLSREEDKTAAHLEAFFKAEGFAPQRYLNNVWCTNSAHDASKPTILLNSHHDTVKANSGWTYPPFEPTVEGDKLTGLGSNDAGGPLVGLIGAFLRLSQKEQPYNLVMAATAEEEISGKNGIASIIDKLPPIDLAVVGEPTKMDLAIAEKGLIVADVKAIGKAGHAARNEGINSIYLAMEDIAWFKSFQFPNVSESLGPIKMSVTQINAGSQHNVVPAECSFVVDIRTTDSYSNQEIVDIISQHVKSDFSPRSLRLNSSGISMEHPIVKRGIDMGKATYGSPTLSDQALMPFTSIKIGPGDSARSHTANEYIYMSEIQQGIDDYVALLDGLALG